MCLFEKNYDDAHARVNDNRTEFLYSAAALSANVRQGFGLALSPSIMRSEKTLCGRSSLIQEGTYVSSRLLTTQSNTETGVRSLFRRTGYAQSTRSLDGHLAEARQLSVASG